MTASVALGFREVHANGDRLGSYLQGASAVEKIHAGKAARAAFLAQQATSVLDLGCGTGDALRLFAADASWRRIVGVDHHEGLLEQARSIEDPRLELVLADAARLPLPDGDVGAVLVERTLQHVADLEAVVAESARVVAAGGLVVLVEPDWSTLGVDGGDPLVTQQVLAAARSLVRHPGVGRTLRRLLNHAGLQDVVLDAEVHETADLALARFLGLLDDATEVVRRSGAVTPAALEAWYAQLVADAAAGDFSASLVLFVAVGRRPGP